MNRESPSATTEINRAAKTELHQASTHQIKVTTQLSQETNDLLTEASLRQRLKKSFHNTRHGIVESAIRLWLREHGYARKGLKEQG